jgi:hypothetical protein
VQLSVRQRNSRKESLRVVQTARGLCAKTPAQARVWVRFACRGPSRARLSQVLLSFFFFLFLPEFRNPYKILEKC